MGRTDLHLLYDLFKKRKTIKNDCNFHYFNNESHEQLMAIQKTIEDCENVINSSAESKHFEDLHGRAKLSDPVALREIKKHPLYSHHVERVVGSAFYIGYKEGRDSLADVPSENPFDQEPGWGPYEPYAKQAYRSGFEIGRSFNRERNS